MVKLINKTTGTPMWVADERVEEYKAAGHKPVASSSALKKPVEETPVVKPVEVKEEVKEEVKPIKKAIKKSTKKR